MSTAVETVAPPIDVEEQARIVSGLLREYAPKLAGLVVELLKVFEVAPVYNLNPAAWLLDQADLLRKPISKIISRASALLEHARLTPLADDELELRLTEVETHLHHVTRLSEQLKYKLGQGRPNLIDGLAGLRVAAGLPATKPGSGR